jgi:TonB family protein
MAALTSTAPATTLPTVPPVTLTSAWTSVGLPDEPLDVAAHNGQLWVSGANEMIAVSDDAGEHWTVRNEHRNGEMLFALVFPAPREIIAYGTAGVRVESQDSGQTWKRSMITPAAGVAQVEQIGSFAVAAAGDNFGTSTDGGMHWQFRALSKRPTVTQVAVLDAEHGLALFEGNKSGQEIVTTEDGGVTWSGNLLSGYAFRGVRTGSAGYVLYGHAIPDDHPVQARSSDGVAWSAAPGSVPEYTQCATQGCLIPGGWTDLTGAAPALWALPPDDAQPITLGWAAVGDTVCRASSELRCRTGRAPWVKPAPPASAEAKPKINPAACRRCPAPRYPRQAERSGWQGQVVLHAIIGRDGKMKQVLVEAAPSAALARAALAAVRNWTYHPFLADNGQPIAVDTQIMVNFTLN